jgi:hypothetical protein
MHRRLSLTAVLAFALTLVVVLAVIAVSAAPAERVALAIGNAGYGSLRPLSNPDDDAAAVAAKLAGLGRSGQTDAGGVRRLPGDPELELAVGAAMRNSGLGAGAYRRLARVQQGGRRRIVGYSSAAGRLAADGSGNHSPYTEALLAELAPPEREVGDLFRQVAFRLGQGGQEPEVLIQGVPPGVWFLRPRGPLPAANPVASPVSPPPALGHLQVGVDAAGARVLVNGQERGLAEPGTLNLANLRIRSMSMASGWPRPRSPRRNGSG